MKIYKNYHEILLLKGNKFRDLWGENAGWAQTIMFIDDLKGFQADKKAKAEPVRLKEESLDLDLLFKIKTEPETKESVKLKQKRSNSNMTDSPKPKMSIKKRK